MVMVKKYGTAILIWMLLIPIAILNGGLREYVLVYLGVIARPLSGIILSSCIFAVAFFMIRGCKIFCVYGNETFQIRIRYVVVFVGFCSRVFCRIYLSGYSISCPLSFMHAF